MGRIEEALRRAGLATPEPTENVGTAKGDVFVSAWPISSASAELGSFELDARPSVRLNDSDGLFRGLSPDWADRLVVPENTNHALIEQFRQLGGALHQAQEGGKLKSVMVTSASPADGKTFTATNIALTLALSYGRRVLLIDADLRRPSIDRIFNVTNSSGLSDALRSDTDRKLPVYELTEGLTFLPSGEPDRDPISGLTSVRMKSILAEAGEQFDWIILDAPPATPLADAGLIGAMVDALVLVVRVGQTQFGAVERALETLGRDRIFGVVLNGAEQTSFEYRSYGAVESADSRPGRRPKV